MIEPPDLQPLTPEQEAWAKANPLPPGPRQRWFVDVRDFVIAGHASPSVEMVNITDYSRGGMTFERRVGLTMIDPTESLRMQAVRGGAVTFVAMQKVDLMQQAEGPYRVEIHGVVLDTFNGSPGLPDIVVLGAYDFAKITAP